jgi:hypothetical protein
MWEFPRLNALAGSGARRSPGYVLVTLTGLKARTFRPAGAIDSIFTHHRIRTHVFVAEGLRQTRIRLGDHAAWTWAMPEKLADLPSSKAHRRQFQAALDSIK